MRAVWWILVCACGGTSAPPAPANVAPPSAPAPKEKVVENCEGRLENWKPGNHDRFGFEDPKTGLHGYKDGKGKVVIAPTYRHAYEFSPYGIAAVIDPSRSGSPFQFIDTTGKVLAQAFSFDNGPDYFQEGYARIVDDKKRVGFIDQRGTIVIPPQFVSAASFCHGKAEVETDIGTHFIDRQGNKTQPPVPEAAD